ncbi:MAG: hypothetical protein IGS39_13060 [Calothrix sp. C42_A2020_038]|nr:hypothetical protein [Calothrix sp. C42_A2020_038]
MSKVLGSCGTSFPAYSNVQVGMPEPQDIIHTTKINQMNHLSIKGVWHRMSC